MPIRSEGSEISVGFRKANLTSENERRQSDTCSRDAFAGGIYFLEKVNISGPSIWRMRCECGEVFERRANAVKRLTKNLNLASVADQIAIAGNVESIDFLVQTTYR